MSYTILVIEDEEIIANHLRNLLSDMGYQCPEVLPSYESARTALSEMKIDLGTLISEKSGIDIGQYIHDFIKIPFIYLTAHADERTFESAKVTLPAAFLIKPFKPVELKPTIEIAINNFRILEGKNRNHALWDQLSATEKLIIKMISEQKTSVQIADQLSISKSTVKNHRHHICQKLNLPHTNNSLLGWVLSNQGWLSQAN